MKFISLVENLRKAINLAERVTGKNLTLPILNNINLVTNKNELHVLATDLELGIELTVSGKVEKDGQVVIPAKTFSSFLNSLAEEKITLEAEKQSLRVKSGTYSALLQGISPEDFPIIPEVKTEKYIEIDKNIFRDAVSQVLPSIGYISTKPELCGVYFKLEKNTLTLVGTDSFRLAEKTITDKDFRTNIKDNLELIVPLKTMQEVSRISQEGQEDINLVRIYPEVNQIQFSFKNSGEIRLVSRLISGRFPEYSSIIPKELENKITLRKKDLADAVRVAGLFCGKINDIKLTINPSQKKIVIDSQDPSSGQSQNTVAASDIKGKALEINFNYRFILDALNSIKDDEIVIGLNKESNPGLFRGEKDNSFVYVLMPIKI